MPLREIQTDHGADPEGSESGVETFRDGWRILKTNVALYHVEGPDPRYGRMGGFVLDLTVSLSGPVVVTLFNMGLVPRCPTATLVTGMVVIAVLCFFAGLILDTVTRGRREVRRLAYLAQPAISRDL
jgi:hypothetical protein